MEEYLQVSEVIDWQEPAVLELARYSSGVGRKLWFGFIASITLVQLKEANYLRKPL
jgi:hypothetical protein